MFVQSREEQILITVKTYPTPAHKGVEVSCTAGITAEGKWIRLFPIPFRFLDGAQQFKKYQWIKANVSKSSDPRPDSYKVQTDSIEKIGSPLPTSNAWAIRKEIVLPTLAPSLCSLERERQKGGPTLGVFKPRSVKRLIITPERIKTWTETELEILSQLSMFDKPPSRRLEKIPYTFMYEFNCNEADCTGHRLSVTDWEFGQSYRSWMATYGSKWEYQFRKKYELEMLLDKDLYFYVGTIRSHPHIWLIIGLFYPPKYENA